MRSSLLLQGVGMNVKNAIRFRGQTPTEKGEFRLRASRNGAEVINDCNFKIDIERYLLQEKKNQ